MIQSVIQLYKGEAKSLHCSTDAVKAETAFNKSDTGVVTWCRMGSYGGIIIRRFDHVASAAQVEKSEADAKQAKLDAATKAVIDGEDADGIALAVAAAVKAVDAPKATEPPKTAELPESAAGESGDK